MATRGGRYQGHCDKRISLASRTLTCARARTSQNQNDKASDQPPTPRSAYFDHPEALTLPDLWGKIVGGAENRPEIGYHRARTAEKVPPGPSRASNDGHRPTLVTIAVPIEMARNDRRRAFCRRSRRSRSRTRPARSPSPAGSLATARRAASPGWRDRRPLTLGAGRGARSPAPPLDRDYRSVSALRPRHRTRCLRLGRLWLSPSFKRASGVISAPCWAPRGYVCALGVEELP